MNNHELILLRRRELFYKLFEYNAHANPHTVMEFYNKYANYYLGD